MPFHKEETVIYRVFVEKKAEAALRARDLQHEISSYLNISSLKGLRLLTRYDVEGIDQPVYKQSLYTVFAEAPLDKLYEENFPSSPEDIIFAVEFLPGQYDQRADSAAQCIQIISHGQLPLVRRADIIVLQGQISEKDLARIKAYLINPVDSREASLEKAVSLDESSESSQTMEILHQFINIDEAKIREMHKELGLAMTEDDLLLCQKYFKNDEKRDPSLAEIKMLDTYWSDHCRHTTFLSELDKIEVEDGPFNQAIKTSLQNYFDAREELGSQKPQSLMDLALCGMKLLKKRGLLNDLEQSREINAASIEIKAEIDGREEDWLLMFKNETHNHPTEISPFGGAATCLGGAIRDPLSGRSYVYQAMRITGAGDPRQPLEETLAGKLPQHKICREAAHGYSSYGNQIGLATGLVHEIYHPGYLAKRMEVGAVVGAAPKANVFRGDPEPGDIILLVGGRTGRDGIGGATGSSRGHDKESVKQCGAEVQQGNPPTERKLQRLFRNPECSRLIKVCNDFGAGGISVAVGELADSLTINLDAVPKKYKGLSGLELALSESQERMAVLLSPRDAATFTKLAEAENLEATQIAQVTESGRVLMTWQGQELVNISREFINTNGAPTRSSALISRVPQTDFFHSKQKPESSNLKKQWLSLLQDINIASQKGLVEQFDSSIGAASVLMPFGGKNQQSPVQVMAAKLPLENHNCNTASLMTWEFDPRLSEWSPYHGSYYAVLGSLAKLLCAGGPFLQARLSFQEYFERLGNDPRKWGKPAAALLGAFQAQQDFGTAAIGGKDSMSGSFEDISVPPTLISFAICACQADNIISPELKGPGHRLVYLPLIRKSDYLPEPQQVIKNYKIVEKLIKEKKIISAYALGRGGLGEALAKTAFGNRIGIKFDDDFDLSTLFNPDYGSLLLEMQEESFHGLDKIGGLQLGQTISQPGLLWIGGQLEWEEALSAWEKPLNEVYPLREKAKPEDINQIGIFVAKQKGEIYQYSKEKTQPRAFVPVFPGTNCEYDSLKAMRQAGARAESYVLRNLTAAAIDESLLELENHIKKAQILFFPGGFSAGDEPDGSGKFIAAVFRNPRLSEAVHELLDKRDGLILGICNGFQALIKLGLLPYGRVTPLKEDTPTLSFNKIGRHISCMIETEVVNNHSPWLQGSKIGQRNTIAISHGEGRFCASEEWIKKLAEKNQIATRYFGDNPNGSAFAIEGITSPDGRIFGKMGHNERYQAGTAINIYGEKQHDIFSSAVNYFS